MHRPGRPSVSDEEVYSVTALLDNDRRHTIGELALVTGLVHTTDNSRPHATQAVDDLFDRWSWEVLYYPLFSMDLSPCDFDLIPMMKEPLRGIRFRTVPDS
ncbi:hypothetical protein AVEN_94737-1 [Araneus ventricosus]|uniref:Tc1-like transposase DDE domain-containing protein n=1 Tax=Araneus ventricosus TaxID=182803 RepID=A0A4Y2CQ42_ARAVE|nr:hypothetical protein AVEN_94737-1 [Araneus ventricosus]